MRIKGNHLGDYWGRFFFLLKRQVEETITLTLFFLPLVVGMREHDFQSWDRHAVAMTGDSFNALRTAKQRDKERPGFILKSPTATQELPNFGLLGMWENECIA